MRKFILIAAFFLMASAAFASGAKPHCIDSSIRSETPYGQGRMSQLFLHVYDAYLWTDAKNWSMDSVFALEIRYNMEIDNDDLVDRSIEEMQHISTIAPEKVASYKEQLMRVFPNVKKGDSITALYDPAKGIQFFYNDKLYGTIKDHELAAQFMLIWFSPNTSEPKLRADLLGGHAA